MSERGGRGRLIVFEGIDGSGKSTLAKGVAATLHAELVAFPTKDTEPGKLIRRVFANPELVCEPAMLYLFVADALDKQRQVDELLVEGKDVVYDRHTVFSAFAYQVTKDRPWSVVEQIIQPMQFLHPDFTFIVDVPVSVAEARIKTRSIVTGESRNEIYEKNLIEKQQRYHRMYEVSAGSVLKVFKLDGTLPPLVLQDQALVLIKKQRTDH